MNNIHKQGVVILDFGSQYTQLIARCVREKNVHTEILPDDELLLFTKEKNIIKAENLFL